MEYTNEGRGTRFQYTYYLPHNSSPVRSLSSTASSSQTRPTNPPIHESITLLDRRAMDAIESGRHDEFAAYLKKTRNTVCGRHPIGVLMGALEIDEDRVAGRFKFVRYEQSSECTTTADSSVSYASGYCVIETE